VVEQGDELAGSGVTAAVLARVFPSTDLSAATDGIADGLYDWENTDPLPLALFDAARVDFSCAAWCTTPAATGAMCSRGSC
jgi:AMP nucleosidase